MAKLFLSYASAHRPKVAELASDIVSLGHVAWYDQELTGGQEWWDHILRQIRACDLFVLVITAETLESEACRRELDYATQLGKSLLPVRLDQPFDLDHVPRVVSRRQIVNYGRGEKSGVLELNKALQTVATSGPLPDPLPSPPTVPISYVAEIIEEIRRKDRLEHDEQIAIVFRLRDHLRQSGDYAGVRKAFETMLQRRELYANVRDEIQQILRAAPAGIAPAPPPASRPKSAPAPDTAGTGPAPTSLGCGLGAVSFVFPIVGFILFFVFLSTRRQAAFEALAWAIGGSVMGCFCGGILAPAVIDSMITEFEPAYEPYPVPMYPGY